QSASVLNENILTYRQPLRADSDNLDLTGGFTIQTSRGEAVFAQSQQFATDVTGSNALGAGAVPLSTGSGTNEWALLSYLGRANYSLADKYLFTLTGRADGSSKFGADNKWGFFPSAAFAWRISEEPFLAGADWLTDFKLRVSYGHTGNQEIGSYRSLARLGNTTYPFGNDVLASGYYPNSVANPELRWEQSEQFDAGFDAAFLDNRFNLTFDVYQKTTDDLLMDVPLPIESGFTVALMNVGSIENQGAELSIGADVSRSASGLSCDATLNLSANRHKVLSLGGTRELYGGGTSTADGLVVREGAPLGRFWGYPTDGI